MHIDAERVFSDIQLIRKFSPLIHNITNYVVMEHTANGLLAIGASPVMTHAIEEVEDMTRLAKSLVLNIGTLSTPWIQGMLLALKSANSAGIPVILDPVGAGATPYRTETVHALLAHGRITAIRGNAAEIVSLHGKQGLSKGVDSLLNAKDCLEQAKELALAKNCTVWMSGKTDAVTNGHSLILVHNGHPLMTKVIGMGCLATALTGAFLAVNKDPLLGSAHAAILMGVVDQMASKTIPGPGSFKVAFMDVLYHITLNHIEEHMSVEIL